MFFGGFSEAAALAVCDADIAAVEALVERNLLRREAQPDGINRHGMFERSRVHAGASGLRRRRGARSEPPRKVLPGTRGGGGRGALGSSSRADARRLAPDARAGARQPAGGAFLGRRPDKEGIGRTTHLLAHVKRAQGDRDTALELAEESLALARSLAHTRRIIVSLGMTGRLTGERRDRAEALRLLGEARQLARESGDETELTSLYLTKSRLEHAWGEHETAQQDALDGLTVALAYGMHANAASLLSHLALLAAAKAPLDAARLLGAADSLEDAVGGQLEFDRRGLESLVAGLTTELGVEALDEERAYGRRLSPEEAVAVAFGDDALRARRSERASRRTQ